MGTQRRRLMWYDQFVRSNDVIANRLNLIKIFICTFNTYQLLMIKAVDKLSQKPNLEAKVGQININVF
jgi:hypothetical protein